MDLIIRGATLVTAGSRSLVDIGVESGRVVQMGGVMSGGDELNAKGRIVTPGGVDAHTHLTPPTRIVEGFRWSDDFESGTRAALAGGITTVGNMSFPERGEAMPVGIARDDEEAQRLAIADYFFHPVMMSPTEENLNSIEGLHADGHTSLKIFMSFKSFDRHVNEYVSAMLKVRQAGGIMLIHCEDAAIMECCCNLLRELGRTDAKYYPDSRPVVSEVVSTQRAVGFAEATGCPTYIVHLASARALMACQDGRSRGLPVYVETRPLYLHLTRQRFNEEDGAKYAGAPPLREQSDVDAMWAGIQFGHIDTLATDHAPWKLAEKLDPAFDATNLRQGVADLQTSMPMLYSAGVLTGRISIEQFVAVTATNPAKLFGLYPRKGTIAVGSDADMVIWDEHKVQTIDGAKMYSRSGYSPYDGFEVRGWPAWTISRGEVVFADGEVTAAPGRGQLIRRGPHRAI
jgi:dihydropyrimidinase